MKILLTSPVPYKDSKLDVIDLDLDALTGRDLIAVEDSARSTGTTFNLFSQGYFAAVAAKAAHLPLEVINSLNVKDFMKLTTQTMNFLLDGVSETQQPVISEG